MKYCKVTDNGSDLKKRRKFPHSVAVLGVDRITSTYGVVYAHVGPPLWSSGQSFWLQIQRFRVRFPALPDFLSSSGSGTGPLSLVRSIEELLE